MKVSTDHAVPNTEEGTSAVRPTTSKTKTISSDKETPRINRCRLFPTRAQCSYELPVSEY